MPELPSVVHLWLPRGDEYELAASLGMVDKDRQLQHQLVNAAQEQIARDLPGVPVRVHRYHVWRIIRTLARLQMLNDPAGRSAAIVMLAEGSDEREPD